MKLFRSISALMAAPLLSLVLYSCHRDVLEDYPEEPEITMEELNPQVVSSFSIPMYQIYQSLAETTKASLRSGANEEEDESVLKWAQAQMDALYKMAEQKALEDAGISPDDAHGKLQSLTPAILAILESILLKAQVMTYTTLGADGKTIQSSMLVAWPWNPILPNPHPDHVILGCHATVTSDKQRPTNYSDLPLQTDVRIIVGEWASKAIVVELGSAIYNLIASPVQCLVVMPDYEGYGNTSTKPHPYLNRELQGRQCVDAALAALQWYEANEKSLNDDYKTVSVGYSQGGAISAASYRYWLEHKTRYSKLNYAGAVCGDGPYDPYATLKLYVSRNEMEMPCAPALVLKGMVDSDKEMLAAGARLEDYLTPDFIATGIFDAIATKRYKTDELDDMVRAYAIKNPGTLRYNRSGNVLAETVLNPATFAYFKNGTLPADKDMADKLVLLKHCLRKNALNFKKDDQDWLPPTGAKFSFFHSPLDIVVPYDNLTSVKQSWGDNSNRCRYIKYEANIPSHSDVGTQFMLECMVGEVYLLLQEEWSAKSFSMSDTQWTP